MNNTASIQPKPKVTAKAWECKLYDSDNERGDIFYGEKRSIAMKNALASWSDTMMIRYIEIKAKRNADYDLIENKPEPIIAELSETQIKNMLHITGLSNSTNQYRNYFASNKAVPDLEDLIEKELAFKFKKNKSIIYQLNKKGLAAIKSTKPLLRKEYQQNLK